MQEITLGKISTIEETSKEAYKTLKTNISFCGNNIKTILITSASPNEGKTTVSFNLAQTLARDRKKVLYIDADLRNSTFNTEYNVSSDVPLYGLSNYLVHQINHSNVIYRSNLHYLDIILSGPSVPNPTLLLEDESMEYLLEQVRNLYDYIIIDTPPLGNVIDAAIISPYVDGAVLVIEKDHLSYKEALSVTKQLEKSKCRILGAVLNKSDIDKKRYIKNEVYEH